MGDDFVRPDCPETVTTAMNASPFAGKSVLIDGFNLGLEKGTGVATYARNLSHELHALGFDVSVVYGNRAGASKNMLIREIAFFDRNSGETGRLSRLLDDTRRLVFSPLSQRAVEIPITGKVLADTFKARLPYFDHILNANNLFNRIDSAFTLVKRMSMLTVPDRPDLCHWTYPLPVRVQGAANVYTLHDIVPLRLPYTTLDKKKRYYDLLNRISKSADHIVTVSDCSRRDLIDVLGFDEKRVTNTYQAVDIPEKFRTKPDEQVAREVEGVTGLPYKGYFLFWGSIEPKKNIGRMIEAYLASGVQAPLVMVGAQAWKAEEEMRLVDDERLSFFDRGERHIVKRKRIIQLSYAPFSLLVSLIRGAKAALFPSLYEGFGLPALEAMLLGTPVICSNTSSLPEVAGDAALMVDPYDTLAITRAIRAVDADADLRAEHAARGLLQAARFSREAHRERLAEVYRQVT